MVIKKDKLIDLDILGEKLKLWFFERKYEVKTDKGINTYIIKAKKEGKIRIFFSACRALIVICSYEDGKTKVKVKQGSWDKNIWSNIVWFATTGGGQCIIYFLVF